MKITESTVALAAQHSYHEQRQTMLSIRVEQTTPTSRPQVEISDAGKAKATEAASADEEMEHDPRILLIKSLIEVLLGHEFKLFNMKLQNSEQEVSAPSTAAPETQGGVAIDYRQSYEESETVSFQGSGIIKTADGREIEFHAELDMSRNYHEETRLQAASGSLARPMKDPLVLNYMAPAATLSSQTFAFDIDADGNQDEISLLNQGSAFLMLDLNNDSKVNDGRELFGAQSGDGFADLSQHDHDRNGWIDENDVVFAKLKLWIKDTNGTDKLVDLKSMGIGAIYLGKAKADFSLNDANNNTLGQSRAAGIYLNEDGSGGTIQQLDLAA